MKNATQSVNTKFTNKEICTCVQKQHKNRTNIYNYYWQEQQRKPATLIEQLPGWRTNNSRENWGSIAALEPGGSPLCRPVNN